MSFKVRYFGIEFYGVLQFYDIPVPIVPVIIEPNYSTLVELRTKEDGLKRQWYYNQDNNNPVSSISVELTEKGCGVAKVTFSDLMYPINSEDMLRIRIKGVLVYEGSVNNDVDISDPVLTASGLWNRFDELVYSGTYGAGTDVSNILQGIVSGLSSSSKVNWNGSKVVIGGTHPTLAIKYQDDKAKEIIDTLVGLCGANYYWGVDTARDFYCRAYPDPITTIDKAYYSKDNAEFEDVTFTLDYSKVTMTEAVVYKNNNSGVTTRVGQVANSGNATYPPLDIAKKVRQKVIKLIASQYVDDTTALKWAYEQVKSQAYRSLSVKISKIDYTKYIPFPGAIVLAEGSFDKAMVTIIPCDSVTGWTNVTLSAGNGKDSGNAINLFNDGSNNSYFDFGATVSYYKQQRVGLYLKTPINTVMSVAFSNNATPGTGEWKYISLPDAGLGYYDFDYPAPFRYVHFKYVAGNIYVDDIQVFCETKRQFVTPIKKTSIKWDSTGIQVDCDGGDITNMETYEYQELNRQIKVLDAINNPIA